MNASLLGAAAFMALLTGCASTYVEVVGRTAIYDNGQGMQILEEKWGFSSDDVRHIEYVAVNRSQRPMCAQVFIDEKREDLREHFDGSVVEPGARKDLATWYEVGSIELQAASWPPRDGRCFVEDRRGVVRSTRYMDQSGRDGDNTLFNLAQGMVSAASEATKQPANPPRTSLTAPPPREAEKSANVRPPTVNRVQPNAQPRTNMTTAPTRPARTAQQAETATQRSRVEAGRERAVPAPDQRVASASTQRAPGGGAARSQAQNGAQEKNDFLRSVATGTRLRAVTCPGGDGKIFVTGTRPRPKPEVVACVDVHYRARCDGSDVFIHGVAGNFVGRAGCFGDTYAIGPTPRCKAERVKVEVAEARACGE